MDRKQKDVLDGKVQKGPLSEIGIPGLKRVELAIKAGNNKEALELLEIAAEQGARNTNSLVSYTEMVLTHLAQFGEEELEKVFRYRYFPHAREFVAAKHTPEEAVRLDAAIHLRHHSTVTVREEADSFVMTCDPCGSGGVLRRSRPIGVTRKAYPWSWGKVGAPYYCCHCALHWEIMPAELQGYPVKTIHIAEKPEDPCIHVFYKKPELIPEKCFTRIGMKRGPAKFKK